MKRKTAVKLLMSCGFDRNEASEYLDRRHKQGYSNERTVRGFQLFKNMFSLPLRIKY